MRSLASYSLLWTLIGLSLVANSQAQNADPNNDTGLHAYETYDGARENISMGTGNVFVSVPLLTLHGRNGHNYSVGLISNSQAWSGAGTTGWTNANVGMVLTRTANFYFHPTGTVNPASGIQCVSGYQLDDESGGVHTFSNMQSNCIWVGGGPNQGLREPQYDVLGGSDDRGEGITADLNGCTLTFKNGNWLPLLSGSGGCPLIGVIGGSASHPATLTDSNGNQILSNAFPGSSSSLILGGGDIFPSGTDTDTLGRTITFFSSNHTIQYKDSGGTQRTITLNVQGLPLSCTFPSPAGHTQPSGTPNAITSAVLPNGLTYIFQYDGCGSLSKIVYPSGGYTRYVFDYSHYTHGINGPGGGVFTDIEIIQKYACRAPSVTPGATSTGAGNTCPVAEDLTTYSPTVNSTICSHSANSVVDPLGNTTAYQFINNTNCAYTVVESNRQIYQGSSTLLRTVQTTYTGGGFTPAYPATITTILPNGLQNQVQYASYGYFDFPGERREYAWGQGGPGSLLRKTDYTYPGYPCDKKSSEIVYDASGIQIAKTTYEFDNYTGGLASSGAVQHTSTLNPSYPKRCNVTAVQPWRNTDGATLTTRMQYDDAGNVLSTTDPLNHTTSVGYADVWGNSTCAPSGGNAAAYPTQLTDALNHTTNKTYNSCTGTVASATDANSQVTTFSYDLMTRLVQTTFPDTGQTSTCFSEVSGSSCYSSSYPLKVVSTQKISSSLLKTSTAVLDGLARVSQTQLNSDPDGITYIDVTYDGAENKATVSNPYRTTSDTTTYNYDALGRVTKVIPPDGTSTNNNASTTYDIPLSSTPPANCTKVTDQAAKSRESCSDALGRLTQAFEDPAGLNYETDYSYDTLDNLTCAVQKGTATTAFTTCAAAPAAWRPRSFTHNSLSQLLTATNPESGTISYSYDNNGNVITKTDARGIKTCFGDWNGTTCNGTTGYDAVNRVLKKTYSDGTPSASLTYDTASLDGHTLTNPVGRLVKLATTDGKTAAWNSYDQMGRITNQWECSPLNCGATPYTKTFANDSLGNHTSETYSYTTGTLTISYGYNGVARPTQVTSSYVDAQHPATLASGITYSPAGAITQLTYGNGVAETRSYNNRLQPTQMRTYNPSSGADILNMSYGFNAGTADNGNVASWSATGQQSFSRSFAYDRLNRVAAMQETSGNAEGCKPGSSQANPYTLSWTIDPWGNRTNQSPSAGTCSFSQAVDGNNRFLAPYQYDAAGNMTNDGSHTYTYDAENRVTQVDGGATASYVYDADGRRVWKSVGGSTTDYMCDLSGKIFATFGPGCTAGCWTAGAVYLNGQFVAEYYNNTTYFVHADHLGSTRVLTAMDRSTFDNMDYLPFGEQIAGDTGSTLKFTGKERDSESGLDNFGARYDSSQIGRFMTPDPLLNSGRPWEPQSWNRYAYALNNPLNIVDPTGLYDLVNNCASDDKKCNKQFRQHADDLKKGLENLQKKVDKMKDGAEKDRLEAALGVVGTEGDHNGVNATFGTLGGDAAAETKFQLNDINQLSTTITFDPSKISGSNEYAIAAAHEGTHLEDEITGLVNTLLAHSSLPQLSDFSLEYRGYQTSIFAASALGMNSFSRSYDRANYVLWNGSWAQVDRNITNFVTRFHDQNGKQTHPETTPHNPWPN